MFKKATIYGERCSGTNYLEQLLILNFNVEIVWDYGWKHFFGYNDLTNSDDVLFIGIIRNLEDWINSLFREKYHLPYELTETVDTYLNNQFYSILKNNDEIMYDRNIETGERYKNIFELRLIKNKFLIEQMKVLVKNYCLIMYDNLVNNFTVVMNKLKDCGLEVKNEDTFPLNVLSYNGWENAVFVKKQNTIPIEKINEKLRDIPELVYYENILFPEITK
jgi:hypothetical protein